MATEVPFNEAEGRSPRRVLPNLLGVMPIRAAAMIVVALLAACGPSAPTGVPLAPRDVVATAIAGGVRITWLDQSSDEDGFVILRKEAGDDGEPTEEVGTTGAGEQVFDDFSTTDDGSYVYGVAAVNVVGPSETVLQEPVEPVSQLPGIDVSIAFDGDGVVSVSGGSVNKVCVTACTVAFASGTTITLTAQGNDGAVFAGWAGACAGAGSCSFAVDDPAQVEARFRRHVLQLELAGDSPVELTMYPADDFGNSKCTLGRGDSCALAYGFAGPLAVSISAIKLEPAGDFQGFDGPCSTQQELYCLANVSGATQVSVLSLRPPVAVADSYELLEDEPLQTSNDAGVLANDIDSPDDTLSTVLVSEPTNGDLELQTDGSFQYEPDDDYFGDDAFQYVARDAYGNESEAVTVSLEILPVNDPPVFSLQGDIDAGTGNGLPRTVTGFATGIGPGGGPREASQSLDSFNVSKVSGNLQMAIPEITLNGTLIFRPPLFSSGSATYEVTLSDDGGTANGGSDTSAPQRFTIAVDSVRLSVSKVGSGEVSASPASADGRYGYGTIVDLFADPAPDHVFGAWQGDCSGMNPSCQLTMNGDRSVTARFDPFVRVRFEQNVGFFSVASSPPGISGCLSFNTGTSGCDAAFPHGSTVTLTANTGSYRFQGVDCEGGSPTGACSFVLDGPVVVTLAPATPGP